MKMQITDTTDRQHLGQIFDYDANPIVLSDGVRVPVDSTMPLPDGMRFISSNYIIDAKGV